MANCGCPPNTVLVTLPNGLQACRQDDVVLAEGPDINAGGCQKLTQGIVAAGPQGPGSFGQSADYCKLGAKFYGETSSLPFPVKFVSGCSVGTQQYQDFSSSPLPLIGSASNTLWGTGAPGFDGRFNLVGANPDVNLPCFNNLSLGYYGYTFCLNVASPTTYCFGFGGCGTKININGGLFIDTGNIDNYQYESWSVVQLTLPAGSYIIEMTGFMTTGVNSCGQFSFATTNPFTQAGFAFEIYQATAALLMTFTNTGQLNPTIIYSTANEAGQPMDYGQSFNNYRCPCDADPMTPTPDCPIPFNQFNTVAPVIDNCTTNPLNPQGDPHIYVCHTYTYTATTSCCFILTNCEDPSIIIKTDTNLTTYVGQVITIQEAQGCWLVGSAIDCDGSEVSVTFIANYSDCTTCLPKCFTLIDCAGVQPAIITNTNLAAQVGNVITIQEAPGCWTVATSTTCNGAITVTVINTYSAGTPVPPCDLCNPPCFQLTDCENPANIIITNTNLSAYLGQVIQLTGCGPKACWTVTRAVDCTGAIAVVVDVSFATCQECLPIIVPDPILLHNRKVKPGYNVSGSCSPEYVDKVSCNFAEEVFKVVKKRRYGISNCCGDDLLKYQIKKELLDLNMIYDPKACVKSACCAPTCLTLEFKVYNPFSCPEPANLEVSFIYPTVCPAPNSIGPVQIVFNNPVS